MSSDDVEAIRSLVHRYADAACRDDHEAWVGTWADDGVWEIGRGPVVGRAAIAAAFARAMGLFEAVVQLAHNGEATVDGDRATGRWYMSEATLTHTGKRALYYGYYDDVYVRTAAGWRFASRRLTWLYQGPPDLTGAFGPPAGYYAS